MAKEFRFRRYVALGNSMSDCDHYAAYDAAERFGERRRSIIAEAHGLRPGQRAASTVECPRSPNAS